MAEYSGAISLSKGRQCHSSEDEDEDQSPRSGATPPLMTKLTTNTNSNKSGGVDIGSSSSAREVGRKPRGRPPGSKNKPKPPIVITKDSDSTMQPLLLELSAGSDVVDMVYNFSRRRHVGLCILNGSGSVSNITLRHPSSHNATLTIPGRFEILSLSGSFLPPSPSSSTKSPSLTICVAGGQGQVIGGIVAGALIAASQVVLVAASFVNPSFHRLPVEDEETEDVKPSKLISSVGLGGGSDQASTVYSVSAPNPLNCQIPPDVLPWASTSRPPY